MTAQTFAFYGFAFCAFGVGFSLGQAVTMWMIRGPK
jgi:hypothetical protein